MSKVKTVSEKGLEFPVISAPVEAGTPLQVSKAA